MLLKVVRAASVPVSRSQLFRALALCGPLALLLVLDKALKLSNELLANDRHIGLGGVIWHSFLGPIIGSGLAELALGVLVIGKLLALLFGRRGHSERGWYLAVPLVYLAAVAGGLSRGDANPFWPFVVSQAFTDAFRFVGLWWRDAAVLVALTGLLAWHLSRAPSQVRGMLVWTAIALAHVVVVLDIGFFVATRAPLKARDVYFALTSPHDALAVSRGAISMNAGILLLEILLLCLLSGAVCSWLLRRRGLGAGHGRRPGVVRVGVALWPALVLALVSPTGARERWGAPGSDDPILSLTVHEAETKTAQMIVLRGSGAPSWVVPIIDPNPPTIRASTALMPLNVVIIMLESARARDTSVYSPQLTTTPYLADLARESLVVDHMYAVIPRTDDAWIAILAGRYPSVDSLVTRWADANPRPMPSSMPHLLRSQGYISAFFRPTTRDFGSDAAVARTLDFDKVVTKESIPRPASGLVTPFGWEDRALLAPIGRWLDDRAADKRPFFMAVMSNIGHTPYDLPPGYRSERFPSLNDEHERYLNCLHYLDGYVRDLVQELRERGLLERTVLLVMGDHGEAFGEHGSLFRGEGLYEEVLQIPMIIRLPDSAQRRGHIGGLHQEVDVLPTVADALGLRLSGGAPAGASMLSDPDAHKALFFSQYFNDTALALRIGNLKYVYHYGDEPLEIFDLKRDPLERRNIADQVSLHDQMQAQTDMLAWSEAVAQTFHSPEPQTLDSPRR